MKKFLKWTGIVLLSPVLLFLFLTLLLYIPSIQRFVVKQAVIYTSELTGMDVRMDAVRLAFPLDLSLQGVRISDKQADVLLDVQKIIADIELLPLITGQVEVNALEINKALVNTKNLIPGVQIKGSLGRFFLDSHGVKLPDEEAFLDRVLLENTQVEVLLSDSVPEDTTASSPVNWQIMLKKVAIRHTVFKLRMPGDTMVVGGNIREALLSDGHIDLKKALYKAGRFNLNADSVFYEMTYVPKVQGVDYNHLLIRSLNVAADSIRFCAENTALSLLLKTCTFKEKSGLNIQALHGTLRMDSSSIYLPDLALKTLDSDLRGQIDVDFTAFKNNKKGRILTRISGELGKQDIMLFMGGLPASFIHSYPNRPLVLRLSADGTMEHLQINRLELGLGTAFSLVAKGRLNDIIHETKRTGEIKLQLKTQNLSFMKSLGDPVIMRDIAIPFMALDGRLTLTGTKYGADLLLRQGSGTITFQGNFDSKRMTYRSELNVNNLQMNHFFPKDSLYQFSASAAIDGVGVDPLSATTRFNAHAAVDRLEYGALNLNGVNLEAGLKKGKAHIVFNSDNPFLKMFAKADALVTHKEVGVTFSLDLQTADWYGLRLSEHPFKTSMCMHLDGETNLKNAHNLQGSISDLALITEDTVFRPKDLQIDVLANPDTLYAYILAGDLMINMSGRGSYDRIQKQSENFVFELREQMKKKRIDQLGLKAYLPKAKLRVKSGNDNPLANYLAAKGYKIREMDLDLNADPEVGLNGGGHLYSLNTGSILLDTIQVTIFQDSTGVKTEGRVRNGPKNKQFVFDARMNSYIHETGAGFNLVYFDEHQKKGVNIGARAEIEENGLRVRFSPLQSIIAYRTFQLNADNFIFLGNDKRVEANVDLLADDGTGLKVYSSPNENALQDISISVNRVNLGELSSVLPYFPRITGFLNGDAHLEQTAENISVVTDMKVTDMTYEGVPLGLIGLDAVYLPNEDNTHYVDARVSQNNREILNLSGTYTSDDKDGVIDAEIGMLHFPFAMANGFITDQLAVLTGYGDGTLKIKGQVSKPILDGKLYIDSVFVKSDEYSLNLRLANDSIEIANSNLLFDKLNVYSLNENPLVIDGYVNFRHLERVKIRTTVQSHNFELINAPRTQKAVAYGKVYVDFNALLEGTLDNLVLKGQLNVLGNTDVTYVLKDSPLTVEDRLSDLVTFVDFTDVAEEKIPEPITPLGIDMLLLIGIDQAAQVHCILSADRSNYIELEGGGNLTMTYTPQGQLQMNGRYTVLSGEMKYSLPVIPLKTFSLKNGSYVEFNGNVMNPTLNIAATERVRTTVTENNSPRTVSFDVGLSITQNLENMGLEFTLEAPEDMTVQNELASMSVEQRGRLAVTMLATGMYLANNNGGSFSTQNALNSFLQSEISNITGSALKTIDISVGMESATSADGNSHTDYSFRFAKRFWGNRVSVIIGGKVSAGDEVENTGQTLIDNVSLEYRLDKSATRYVKLFYDKTYESLLEGEITEMGAGLVLRRKMTRLGELFIFRNKKDKGKLQPIHQEKK